MAVASTKKVASKGLIKTLEIKTNCSYQTEDGKFIDKILDGIANVSVETSEKVGDFLQFVGKVCLTSIFVDNEKQLGSEKIESNFSEKVQIGDADATVIIPKVVSVKQRRETSNYVDCSIILSVEIYGVLQETIAYVDSGNVGLVEKTKEIEAESLLCFNNSAFNINDEIDSVDHIDKIIASYTNFTINKVVPNGNYVTVDGELNRDVLYLSDGITKKLQKRNDFTQELALLNCNDETIISSHIYLSDDSLSFGLSDDGTKSVITCNANISVSVWGFERIKFNCLDDVYSTNKELEIKHSTFSNIIQYNSAFGSENLLVNIDMSDKKRIDEIVSIGSNSVLINSVVVEKSVCKIGGVITQKIIAKNYDNDDIFSMEIEVPYSTQININVEENAECNPCVVAKCVNAKNKAGKELSLTYEINIMSDISQKKLESYISECNELTDKALSKHSIVIYMPEKTEKIFDIAKKLSVTPEVILAQNPGISDNEPIEKVTLFKCMK